MISIDEIIIGGPRTTCRSVMVYKPIKSAFCFCLVPGGLGGICKNIVLSVMVHKVRLGGSTVGLWIFCGSFSKLSGTSLINSS